MDCAAAGTVIFDTDVLIWAERGNVKALEVIGNSSERAISIYTYMELLQGVRSASESKVLRSFLSEGAFQIFPLTENIGHRALIYVEEHGRSAGLKAADAIIAATAVENGFRLVSANQKHYKSIRELQFQPFRP